MKDNNAGYIIVGIIVLIGAVITAWFITGGDVRCMLAEDPAMCATLRDVGKP